MLLLINGTLIGLELTTNILENFAEYWNRPEGDGEGRHELVRLIVYRVYIEDEPAVAMMLNSNYHLILGHNAKEPTEYSVDPYKEQFHGLVMDAPWLKSLTAVFSQKRPL